MADRENSYTHEALIDGKQILVLVSEDEATDLPSEIEVIVPNEGDRGLGLQSQERQTTPELRQSSKQSTTLMAVLLNWMGMKSGVSGRITLPRNTPRDFSLIEDAASPNNYAAQFVLLEYFGLRPLADRKRRFVEEKDSLLAHFGLRDALYDLDVTPRMKQLRGYDRGFFR